MLKKLVVPLWACLLLSTLYAFAEDLTCEKDHKVSLPQGKICCCNEVTPSNFVCKPTTPIDEEGKKCPPGLVKVATRENICICRFHKQ